MSVTPPKEGAKQNAPDGHRSRKPGRLLVHADFERVYRDGKRQFFPHMTVFFTPATSAHELRVGLTVSRALGGAVDRNRIRRRMREAIRFCRPQSAPAMDVVINPKKSVLKANFEDLRKEVARAFEVVVRGVEGGGKR